MKIGKEILQSFVSAIIQSKKPAQILALNISNFDLFSGLEHGSTVKVSTTEQIPRNKQFELVLGDLPFGMGLVEWKDQLSGTTIRIQRNWMHLLQSLEVLSSNGLGIFLIEPHGLTSNQGREFKETLETHGFYVTGMFNTPENLLQPTTSIRTVLICISKTKPSNLYLAELEESKQAASIASNFQNRTDTGTLSGGTLIDTDSFVGFHKMKILQQIARLKTQYKEYDTYQLGDLATEIKSIKSGEEHIEHQNAVYIPRIGKSKVCSNLKEAKLKDHNYFQVVLKDLTLNEYVSLFFDSTLGRLILDSLSVQSFIPHVNKYDIEQIPIAVPTIIEQRSIVLTQHKFQELQNVIEGFSDEIALNPTSSVSIQGQLGRMLEAIAILTDGDRVRSLAREGESKTVEFKESLSLDINKQTKEAYIEVSALKTIVAFLNTDGGILLVGVADDGRLGGIDEEIKKLYENTDKFLLHFKNLLKSKIGEDFYPFLDYRLVKVDETNILLVECKASETACYLEGKDFYVRTNPATDKLEGPKLVAYVKHHFGG